MVTSKHMEKLSFPLLQRAEGCASSGDYQAPMDWLQELKPMSVSAEDALVLFRVTCVYWCLQNVFVGISCCGAISRRQLLRLFFFA